MRLANGNELASKMKLARVCWTSSIEARAACIDPPPFDFTSLTIGTRLPMIASLKKEIERKK